jgi:hypothetical protein
MRGREYANKEMTIHSNPQLNDADLELLSAYIDHQLGDGERAALERRLSQEPVLRGVLDELRATVGLLHDLEPLRPPRSFAIAAPATAPGRLWSFPWRAIASALVALVCLLTFSYALIRSSGSPNTASAPAPAAMQEATAPTAAAAGGAPQDSAMRQTTGVTAAPAAAAPAAAAPTAAPAAEAPAAPMAAAEAATAAPAAAAPMTAIEAPAATPAPTTLESGGAGAPATAQPAELEPPAADSAAPTAAAAEAPASAALKGTAVPAQQPYNALVATSEISSPDTVMLDQPPIAPTANSAPSGGSSNLWLLVGIVAVLIAVVIGLALRRKARE